MRIKYLLALALVFVVSAAHAQGTPRDKATLNSETAAQLPDNSVGSITPLSLRTIFNDVVASSQQFPCVNARTATSYTITATDAGCLVTFNNASPVAVTLPAITGYFVSFNVYLKNMGAGLVTVTPAVGTINGGASITLANGASIEARSDGSNYQTYGSSPATPFALNIGGTGADLSATGGTSQFLKQNTVGGAIVPTRPACADLSNAASSCATDATNATNITTGTLPAARTNGHMNGTATNDAGAAGEVGELIQSNIVVGSAVSLSTGVPANLTSISLTAGDWDVSIFAQFNPAATTNITALIASISQTSATRDSVTGGAENSSRYAGFVPANVMSIPVLPIRISLSSTTTIFAVMQANFTVSTLNVYGIIRARRVR